MTRLVLPANDRIQRRRGRKKTSFVPVRLEYVPTNTRTRTPRQHATVCQSHRAAAAGARAAMTEKQTHPPSIQTYGRVECSGTSARPFVGKGIIYGRDHPRLFHPAPGPCNLETAFALSVRAVESPCARSLSSPPSSWLVRSSPPTARGATSSS